MKWDPAQYGRYADERSRPFADLVARIGCAQPRRVVDLGCGPGNLTALLAQRWPRATVEGLDTSAEMIASAAEYAAPKLTFRVADVIGWEMPADADVVVSNAVLQWVPSHRELLTRWAATLPSDGWLGFQVPSTFTSPSHESMRRLAATPRWAPLLHGVLRDDDAVAAPAEYAALLLSAGLTVDVWETTYLHVLPGVDPVLDWLRGTGLRPVLAALVPADTAEFETSFAALLREAYPATPHGTLLPYRRVFVVAHKP